MMPILIYVVFSISLFTLKSIYYHVFIALIVLSLLLLLPFSKVKSGFLPIIVFLLFTFGGNLFFHPGRIIYDNGFLLITNEGLITSCVRTLRVFSMIFGAKILTHVLPADEMIQAMDRMLRPLEKMGLPVGNFFYVMGLTLKVFPVLIDYLSRAYREDVVNNGVSGFRGRMRHMVLFLMPVFIRSIRSPESFFASDRNGKGH